MSATEFFMGGTRQFATWALMLVMACVPLRTAGQSRPEMTPQAKQLFDETIAALGGAAYLDVRNTTTSGRLFELRGGTTSGMTNFKDYVVYPDKVRTEFGQKHQLVMINNRLRGWVLGNGIFRTQSAEEVVGFLRSQQHDLDRTLRWRIFHEKCVLTVSGKVAVDNGTVLKLDLVFPGVETMSLFVDPTSKLPVKFSYHVPSDVRQAAGAKSAASPAPDDAVQEEIAYSNYHAVQGVIVPYHQIISRGGAGSAEIFLDQIRLNTALSESLFTDPSSKVRPKR